jgi:ubiquinone/menaquinone biosynthesis C-methylase UbiE
MDTDEPTADGAALNDHYGMADLGDTILDALDAAGKDVDGLTRADIASFDEFHIRGLEATREVADLAGIEAGARVLDVGCGVGGPARTLAAEFDCEVVGIDLVEEYCRTATLFTEKVGLTDSVRFEHGSALDLPFEDEAFDVVWFSHTLMNIEAKERAFREARRVLRPGGTLALYEICAGPGGETVFPVPWASDASLSHLVPPERLRELVIDLGFDEVVWRDVTDRSLDWFRDVVASMQSRPPDAPPPLGLNLLMGSESPAKAENVVRNLEEERIVVVQGAYERVELPAGESAGTSIDLEW